MIIFNSVGVNPVLNSISQNSENELSESQQQYIQIFLGIQVGNDSVLDGQILSNNIVNCKIIFLQCFLTFWVIQKSVALISLVQYFCFFVYAYFMAINLFFSESYIGVIIERFVQYSNNNTSDEQFQNYQKGYFSDQGLFIIISFVLTCGCYLVIQYKNFQQKKLEFNQQIQNSYNLKALSEVLISKDFNPLIQIHGIDFKKTIESLEKKYKVRQQIIQNKGQNKLYYERLLDKFLQHKQMVKQCLSKIIDKKEYKKNDNIKIIQQNEQQKQTVNFNDLKNYETQLSVFANLDQKNKKNSKPSQLKIQNNIQDHKIIENQQENTIQEIIINLDGNNQKQKEKENQLIYCVEFIAKEVRDQLDIQSQQGFYDFLNEDLNIFTQQQNIKEHQNLTPKQYQGISNFQNANVNDEAGQLSPDRSTTSRQLNLDFQFSQRNYSNYNNNINNENNNCNLIQNQANSNFNHSTANENNNQFKYLGDNFISINDIKSPVSKQFSMGQIQNLVKSLPQSTNLNTNNNQNNSSNTNTNKKQANSKQSQISFHQQQQQKSTKGIIHQSGNLQSQFYQQLPALNIFQKSSESINYLRNQNMNNLNSNNNIQNSMLFKSIDSANKQKEQNFIGHFHDIYSLNDEIFSVLNSIWAFQSEEEKKQIKYKFVQQQKQDTALQEQNKLMKSKITKNSKNKRKKNKNDTLLVVEKPFVFKDKLLFQFYQKEKKVNKNQGQLDAIFEAAEKNEKQKEKNKGKQNDKSNESDINEQLQKEINEENNKNQLKNMKNLKEVVLKLSKINIRLLKYNFTNFFLKGGNTQIIEEVNLSLFLRNCNHILFDNKMRILKEYNNINLLKLNQDKLQLTTFFMILFYSVIKIGNTKIFDINFNEKDVENLGCQIKLIYEDLKQQKIFFEKYIKSQNQTEIQKMPKKIQLLNLILKKIGCEKSLEINYESEQNYQQVDNKKENQNSLKEINISFTFCKDLNNRAGNLMQNKYLTKLKYQVENNNISSFLQINSNYNNSLKNINKNVLCYQNSNSTSHVNFEQSTRIQHPLASNYGNFRPSNFNRFSKFEEVVSQNSETDQCENNKDVEINNNLVLKNNCQDKQNLKISGNEGNNINEDEVVINNNIQKYNSVFYCNKSDIIERESSKEQSIQQQQQQLKQSLNSCSINGHTKSYLLLDQDSALNQNSQMYFQTDNNIYQTIKTNCYKFKN
ncbi:hypothetical protein PPERSA_10819 [Pseudocohnilembus persalinus]|uniref:Transmembrane protein n=1 Tax=Pseudocohnilembus persalinus TaxID=266149 RepID=A0A0V0QDV1_PSEPJ|nr:hypothetical protein PPERSA_10819 [Pseudocohnilembus persalinus]|eukprot:KRX00320.1 hypothetical protein PPERSA_10819 [Pseudocohnilembus persalinus]